MMRLGMRRLSPGILAALATLAVVLRIGVLLNRRIDPDESQHLHVAWLITQGQVPYRDFWEHHLPFFHYAMAPLTLWLAERPSVYFAARCVMVVLAALAVWLTWRLARRLSADGAVWAAVILMFLPQFAETSTETRPDVPALVAHLASLLALARWRAGGRTRGSGRPGRGRARRWGCRSRRSWPRGSSRVVVWPAAARGLGDAGRRGAVAASSPPWRWCWARSCAALVLFTGPTRFARPLPERGAGLAALRRLRQDLAGVSEARSACSWRLPSGSRSCFACGAWRSSRTPCTARCSCPPSRPRRPVPSLDPRRLPARVAAPAPGDGDLRGPDPRHSGGVGTPGPDAGRRALAAGGDRGRRDRPGWARPWSSPCATRTPPTSG